MEFKPLDIRGAYVIFAKPFQDARGIFRRHFCAAEFAAAGLDGRVAQGNLSENLKKGTLRGFHYLDAACGEAKTLSCLRGSVYDVIVDLRPLSPTYLEWRSVEINDTNRHSIHVPPGCANAFLTLTDDVIVHYYHSCAYVPAAERGIRYNDPQFGFQWPIEPTIISDKDLGYPNFAPARSPDNSDYG
jgi:dTDP-4-dehydrorhamnose 3,5-epimerase